MTSHGYQKKNAQVLQILNRPALANESVGSAASHPALLVDASSPLNRVLQLMRDGGRGAVLVVSNGTLAGIFTERDVLMKVAGQAMDLEQTRLVN